MYTCIQMYTDWDLKYSTPIISPVNAGGEEKLDKKGSPQSSEDSVFRWCFSDT